MSAVVLTYLPDQRNPLESSRQEYEAACQDYRAAMENYCAIDHDSVKKYRAAQERKELARARYLAAMRER